MSLVLAGQASATAVAQSSALIGPSGGQVSSGAVTVAVPRGAFTARTRVTIRRSATSTGSALPGTRARSDVYSVRSSTAPVRRVTVRFRLREALASNARLRAVVAVRAVGSSEWALAPARMSGGRRVVSFSTVDLGLLQVRELTAATARRTSSMASRLEDDLRMLAVGTGLRTDEPPVCSTPPADRTLVVDAIPIEDPPALVCLDGVSGEIALRIVNNRSTSLQFDVPPGMRITDITGQSVSQMFADALNQGSDPRYGLQRLVPAGGSLVLVGTPPPGAVTFRPALTSVLFDTLASLLSRSDVAALKRSGQLVGVAQCVLNVNAVDLVSGLQGVMRDCEVPRSMLTLLQFGLGAVRSVVGIADGINGLYSHRLTVSFPAPIEGDGGIMGRWVGPVTQFPSTRPYRVDLTITELSPGSVAGNTVYPELSCGGPLTYLGPTADGGWRFSEKITFGFCDDGFVEIRRTPAGRSWLWTEEAGGYHAVAALSRPTP